MDTSTGATTIMGDNWAGNYYRGAGFNEITIRDRPRVRGEKNLVQIRETQLTVGEAVELRIYPELTVRSKPWTLWGRVVDKTATAFIIIRIGGDDAGTRIVVPFRYFHDGRVFRLAGIEDDSDASKAM